MKRKQKLQKALVWLLILSLATGSIFAPSPIVKAKTVELRNNPFTYHYETIPLTYVGKNEITQQQASNNILLYGAIGTILGVVPYVGVAYSAGFLAVSTIADPILGKAGTMRIWSGTKKKIATSVITGKSHVVDEWALYRFVFTDQSKTVLMDKSGKVRMR